MNYFSRLTDIVTCNLSEMLAREADAAAALPKIIAEMEEGLAGARRSVTTATGTEGRLQKELDELRGQVDHFTNEARDNLRGGDDSAARLSLMRKQEVADVIAGLEQQHRAACATRDHLSTTLRALEARLSEAKRRQHEMATAPQSSAIKGGKGGSGPLEDDPRSREIDDELASLKRELGQA